MDGARRRGLRRDDEPAARAPALARRGGAVLDAHVRDRADVDGRHREDALPHRGRPPGRGGPDALPRRTAVGLRLVAVGLPAHVHVLRDRLDGVRSQPHGVRDPRPGAALPARRAGQPSGLHGDGRAADERRRRARGRTAAARRRDHAPADDGLDRRLGAGADAVRRRGARADPAGALAPCRRPGAAERADAGQRALSPRGRARALPPPRRTDEPAGVRRVRDARGGERRSVAGARARVAARAARVQGEPHPLQPDGPLRRLVARRDRRFKAELDRGRVPATVRLTRGRDIAAACGQLATTPRGARPGSVRAS